MRTLKSSNLVCFIAMTALGKQGKNITRQIDKWLNTNGTEWTCKRLKALYNAALLLRSGELEKCDRVYQENSIAYHHHDHTPKGVYRYLTSQFIRAQKASVLKRLAAVFRCYTSMTLDRPSKGQKRKALTAITGPSRASYTKEDMLNLGYTGTLGLLSLSLQTPVTKGLTQPPLKEEEIHAEHLRAMSAYYSRYSVPRAMRGVPYASMAMSYMTEPWLPVSIDTQVPCWEMRDFDKSSGWPDNGLSGKVVMLQEQGCKGRTICIPSAWLQLAFMPLHNRLASLARKLLRNVSCVDDQVDGVYPVLQHVQNGGRVFCTDLSSATDNFPLEFSLGVLHALGFKQYALALQELVQTRSFQCDFAPKGKVRYTKGQPMGLYGSFPLFNISNAVLARIAVEDAISFYGEAGLSPFSDATYYKVLGDDIIFSDAAVCRMYQHRLRMMGVPISQEKSFEGNVAEFAGFIILKTNKSCVAFRPYKTPSDETITNPIQYLDTMGYKGTRLSTYWSKAWTVYQRTISSRFIDLSPIERGDLDQFGSIRGDNDTLVNTCNAIKLLTRETGLQFPPEYIEGGKPTTHINTTPLFREKWFTSDYVYDRDLLMSNPDIGLHPMRRKASSLYKDPLMKDARDKMNFAEKLKTLVKDQSERKLTPTPSKESGVSSSGRFKATKKSTPKSDDGPVL